MRTPTLGQVVRQALDVRLGAMRVSMPGRIESFDAATQLARVTPLLKEEYENDEGAAVVEALPVINNVPVFIPGGGMFVDTFPIEAGDECLLIFSDRSLDVWKERGGVVDPVAADRHTLTDAVALVGVRSKPNKATEYDAARRVIGKVGGPRVALSASAVHLGVSHSEDATEAVIKGTTYTNDEATMLQGVATDLATASSLIIAAAAVFTALGTPPASVAPVFGATVAPVGASLASAAASLQSAVGKLNTFAGAMAARLSTIVKVK